MSRRIYKLAFVGEPGAGKSTCIAAISDIAPVSTDVGCTDALSKTKATTTVAFDYGELDLGEGTRLLLYGMPGQSRFSYMLDVVRDGLVGIVVLVDAASERGMAGLEEALVASLDVLREVPFVVALNKMSATTPDLRRWCVELLRRHQLVAPICRIDARLREDVVRVASLLFHLIDYSPQGLSEGVKAWD